MSSPPTSSTSIKAAHLHGRHRRSSSIPLLAAFDPFRRKARPAISPLIIEPSDTAPLIWNTDRDAKVFRDPEPVANKGDSSTSVAGRRERYKNSSPERKIILETEASDLNPETRNDDLVNEGLPTVNRLNHPRTRGHIKGFGKLYQSQVDRKRMRTVSRDDRLIQRGANPRTGLVSPMVVSDNSDENFDRDYISFDAIRYGRPSADARTHSGKWKQDGVGWSLVESPLLSPIPQSTADPISRRVSYKKLENKLVVEMSGVDNPNPKNMTDQQLKRYQAHQDSVSWACRHAEPNTMIDPNTLPPSPRPSSPEGPSTPPNKLQRIRRKIVGSGRREDSNDTVIVADKRAFSVPTPQQGSAERQTPRDVVPFRPARGSLLVSGADKDTVPTGSAFLDQEKQLRSRQIAYHVRGSTRQDQEAQRQFQARRGNPIRATSVEQVATPTLSQYLPKTRFLHPSHFADLETPSYRRPAQLLPVRLQPAEQQRKTIEDACIITTTSTLSQGAEKNRRPKVHRQDGSNGVPRATLRIPPDHWKPRENLLAMKERSCATKLMVDTSDPMLAKSHVRVPPDPVQDSVRLQANTTATMPEVRAPAVQHHTKHQGESSQAKKSSTTRGPATPGLRVGSANIIPDPRQQDREDGAGITLTSDHLGSNISGRHWGHWDSRQELVARLQQKGQEPASTAENVALKLDGGGWFAGHWADRPQDQEETDGGSLEQKPVSVRGWSIFGAVTNAMLWMPTWYDSLQASAKLRYFQQCLYQMACHTTQTLHPSSPTMTVLRTSNIATSVYLQAAKDFLLACVYLLLLLNVVLALKKVLAVLAWIVYWFWHPVGMILAVVKYVLA